MPDDPPMLSYNRPGGLPARGERWGPGMFLLGVVVALTLFAAGFVASLQSQGAAAPAILLIATPMVTFFLGLVLCQIHTTRPMGMGILMITVLSAIALVVLSWRG
jgi:hypothetical protein